MEKCRSDRGSAVKAESRSAKVLQRAEESTQKTRTKADQMRVRKTDRNSRLQAIYSGKTESGLKTGIDNGIKQLTACKALKRIGKKGAAFRAVRDEQAQIQLEIKILTESIAQEKSRLQALDAEIRKRDAIRRFESDREQLQPGDPCPLCGASVHPFLDDGMIDFTELDRIVLDRKEKIRALQVERDSLKTRDLAILERVTIRDDMEQEWGTQCALAGGVWEFGETDGLSDHVRAIRQDVRSARSRLRAAWWFGWRAKWTDRALGWKLETLSKHENSLEKSRTEHETHITTLSRIDQDLVRLSENEEKNCSALLDHLRQWQEKLPDPGDEKTGVMHLTERSTVYRQNRRELAAAESELQSIRSRWQDVLVTFQQIEETSRHLSGESENIQARLNALKADRDSRFGALNPIRERQALKSEIQVLDAEERSLSAEGDRLRHGFEADRETMQRMVDQELEIRKSAMAAEKDLLDQACAKGFSTLTDIQDGLLILKSEPETLRRLVDAEGALKMARESVEALRPEHPTEDSLDTLRYKISDAVKRKNALVQDIDNHERTLEAYIQADRDYRELLHAIAVQEKVFAAAVAAHRGIEGQGRAGGKLQHLLLQQLLEKANRHLGTLNSGRYFLRPAGQDDLGLYVEDAIQSGTLRSVKTLSGGESFLVSLCLALGLSDMAASHHRIESLFLDEGFGKLDDEMLYKVMSSLKSLRANGRMVGIVSHVKRLAQEIPTQIRLEKGPDGSSRIMVVA
ncbi:MAG: SbcC/MukB-like Walker B domain-containing protein [Desulfatirhabdiaceae bacterium]